MASYLAGIAGQALNLTGLVAPDLAGRIAFRLFCATQSAVPARGKARALFDQARATMRQAETMLLAVPDGQVAIHRFAPIGASSGQRHLVVHGWGSRIDYLQALVTSLRLSGAEVVGLDLPGHGLSTGRVLTVPMAAEAIDAAWRQCGRFDAMIGHSFGGFVAAMVAAAPQDWMPRRRPGKLVLIAAPVAAGDVFDGYGTMMGFSPRLRQALDRQAQRRVGRPVDFFAADRMLADLPELPVLVLHAEDDKEVPADAARRYGLAGPNVSVAWINGMGHRRIVSSPRAIEAIKSFLGS